MAISGASSFIGIQLLKEAKKQGWECIAIIRENSINQNTILEIQDIGIIECNMDNYTSLGPLIGEVDCYIHLAWDGTRGHSRLDEQRQGNNYIRSIEAVQSMIDAGCKMVVTAGSQAEYGIINGVITEKTEARPNTAYGRYKLKFYEEAYKICKENDVRIKEPRYFSLYGPNDNKETMIISSLTKMLNNEPCIFTESRQMWDYLYLDDAVRAIISLCSKPCEDGIYNIASGESRELRDFIYEMKRITQSNSELLFGVIPYGPAGIVSIQPSIQKITEQTGWQPSVSFEEGIRTILSEQNL